MSNLGYIKKPIYEYFTWAWECMYGLYIIIWMTQLAEKGPWNVFLFITSIWKIEFEWEFQSASLMCWYGNFYRELINSYKCSYIFMVAKYHAERSRASLISYDRSLNFTKKYLLLHALRQPVHFLPMECPTAFLNYILWFFLSQFKSKT